MTEVQKEPELIYPVDQSKSGRNSYYQFCDYRQQQASYAVCLHTLDAIEENRLASDRFVECQRAYCHDECPAKVLRAQEVAAKRALFFIPRREIEAFTAKATSDDGSKSTGLYDLNNESYARGWAQVGGKIHGEPRKARPAYVPPPVEKKPGFVQMDGAAIVNQISKEDRAKKAEQPKPQPAATAAPAPEASLKPLPGESPLEFVRRRNKLKAEGKL